MVGEREFRTKRQRLLTLTSKSSTSLDGHLCNSAIPNTSLVVLGTGTAT